MIRRDFLKSTLGGALLCARGADAQSAIAATPLVDWAVYHQDVALVKRLLAAGAKVAVVNDFGSSPMQEAAITGNAAVIRALLDAGANVESANQEGQTALMAVARTGNVDAAKMLIKAGADVNATEKFGGQSALMWAAAQRCC